MAGTGPEPEITYFGLQAYLGTTKHMGGLQSTLELIEACHVGEGMRVLDVGCGAGATTCYLAVTYGCRAMGIDLREGMVARARERAEAEGLAGDVEFRVADAQELPFEDATFDVVSQPTTGDTRRAPLNGMEINVIPEPTTIAMLVGAGLLGLGLLRWRKK